MELVNTKLAARAAGGDLIERARLIRLLPERDIASLVVVHAPAGYGKTTVLLQWLTALQQSGEAVAWLAIDASDQDGPGTLLYIAAALARAGVKLDPPLDRFTATHLCPTTESLMALIVNGIARFDAPISLFLDDFHLLGAEGARALAHLIEVAPVSLRVILASRSLPDLRLARARARGSLCEIGLEELRFTRDEAASFMSRYGAPLSDSDLALLDDRVEGWIAGIKLLGLAIRGGMSAHAVLASRSCGQRCVPDFFAEEVFASQSEELRQFLLRTSVLDRLSPQLCEQVSGIAGGAQMLAQIEKSGLFLLPLDEERTCFRYHHLFAAFLRQKLREEAPAMERSLQLRASKWCWETGRHVEAIEHALRGGDPERAAYLLELRCQDMAYTGKFRLVRQVTAEIPEAILNRYPRVMLTMAWLLTRNLRFEETRTLFANVRTRLDEMRERQEATADELRQLEYLLLHREMVLAAAQDDAIEVEKLCERLIDGYPNERHPYLTGTIYSQLLFARREQYRLSELERLTSTAQGILYRSKFAFATIALQASVGPTLFFAGKTDAALSALEHGLAEAIRCGGMNSDLAALPGLPLSEILYETNQLERARQLVQDTLPYATEMGFVDQLLAGFITCARVCRATGDRAGATRALDQATTIAIERSLDRLRFAVVEERVRMLIQDGRPDLAARYINEAGIAGDSVLPRGSVTTTHERRAMAWVRVAQSDNRGAEALTVARHWRSFCAARGAIRSLVSWGILIAQILYVSGDLRGAQRALREAIAHAAGARLVRSFIDEGSIIRNLLIETYVGELEVLHPTDAFASELLDAFDISSDERLSSRPTATSSEGLYGKLSPKECEILSLVSSGMRNREVANTLGMTEGSVKWYMQQVYDKVGTRRRLQAVERARQFGLIA